MSAEDIIYPTQWVCVDCIMLLANGEEPVEATDRIPLSLFSVSADIVPGMSCEHGSGCDWECDTRDFSWSACDGCGSALGGSRHAVTAFSV